MVTNMGSSISLVILLIVIFVMFFLIRTVGTLMFGKNIDVITDKMMDENIVNDTMTDIKAATGLYEAQSKLMYTLSKIETKNKFDSAHCRYCGSYKTDSYNCTQCGAPVK